MCIIGHLYLVVFVCIHHMCFLVRCCVSTVEDPHYPNFALASGEKFDFVTRKWTKIEPMKTARRDASHLVAGGKLYIKGGRSVEDMIIHDMECYDPATNTWEVVLRVDRGHLPEFQNKGGKIAMDASIVDALISDFENEDFMGKGQVLGYSGDAQRCMHLAGML